MVTDDLSGFILYDLSGISFSFYITILLHLADEQLHRLPIFISDHRYILSAKPEVNIRRWLVKLR